MVTPVLVDNSGMGDNLGNLGVIERIILKWFLRKQCSRMWLSTRNSVELLRSW
jgi:hypothetical protein